MGKAIRVGIMGAGWPGAKHAEGYSQAGGFEVTAVADLIPSRRKNILKTFPAAREFADANELLGDPQVDAVSICLPNDLHAPLALAALKAGKHVICETPPGIHSADAKKIAAAAGKAGKVAMYAFQRRFGGAEQAAAQTLEKGYAGELYHARASWMRTRGIPAGTGWFTDRAKSGGGAMIDLGIQMLDLAWQLLGQPAPVNVFAVAHQRLKDTSGVQGTFDVEDSAFALLRFEGGKTLELSASWALNQPSRQQGTTCRVHGTLGAVEVYTPHGPTVYRQFGPKGDAKDTPLKLPKVVGYHAMMRHFHACIAQGISPSPSTADGFTVMRMIDGIYKSLQTQRSVEIRNPSDAPERQGFDPIVSTGG